MKVLYLIDKLDSGGVETIITQLAITLRKTYPQTEIDILTPHRKDSFNKKILNQAGVKIIHTRFKGRLNPFNFFSYYKVISSCRYDVIHINHLRQQLWGAFLSLFVKHSNFITTEHGIYNKKRDFKFLKYVDRFIYSRFRKIVSVSEATQKALLDWLKIKSDRKYCVIYNGINPDNFVNASPACRSELGFDNKDIIIVSISRMAYGKDIATILRALTILPVYYKFLAVGDGPDLELHKQLATDLKISDRVVFTGHRTDIPSLLKMSDIYVASTLFEGFSMSIIEALAAGIPVIGTDISPVREVLVKDKYLFEIGNYKQLATQITLLDLNDAKKNAKMYSLNFSIEKMSLKYYNLYKECIAANSVE